MAERQEERSLWSVRYARCSIVAEALLAWFCFLFIVWFSLSWGAILVNCRLLWWLLGITLLIRKSYLLAQVARSRLEEVGKYC